MSHKNSLQLEYEFEEKHRFPNISIFVLKILYFKHFIIWQRQETTMQIEM